MIGVTGASGFIGSYLVKHLTNQLGDRIRVLCRRIPPYIHGTRIDVQVGDLLVKKDCSRFVAGLDTIVHLAHRNVPASSEVDPAKDVLENTVSLLNILDAISSAGIKPHVVYFSSAGAIYGGRTGETPYDEAAQCQPSSSYGIQKLACEHYLRLFAERGILSCSVLRVSNAYGTLLRPDREQGLIGIAVNNALNGRRTRIWADLNTVRDYVHLSDICSLVKLVITRPQCGFAVFNAGSGVGYSVGAALDVVERCLGKPLDIEIVTDSYMRTWFANWIIVDISKVSREFGWTPKETLESGIRRMLAEQKDFAPITPSRE